MKNQRNHLQQQNQQYQQIKPHSQQSQRQPQAEVDFFSKFGQPQSQQGWRSQQQQQQQNQDNTALQRMKYREELDRQIQEKKNREIEQQQQKNQQDFSKRPASNPTNVFDFPQEYDYRNNPPPQSPNQYQPPQSAPTDDQSKGRYLQRRFTSGEPEDPQKQVIKEQYAEELKRQMEEKKRKKREEDEENRRRDELEQQQFQQQILLEKKRQEEQVKQKQAEQFDQPVQQKEVGRRGKQNVQNDQPHQDIIKKSALQILSPESDLQREQLSSVQDQRHQQQQQQQQQYQQQQYIQQQQPQYQQYSQLQQHTQQTPYQHNPYHPPMSPLMNVYNQFHLQDNLQQYQQVLFNDQNTHHPQAIMVHQQYLMQLQQNRQEIDLVRQILEEKLRLQQIEMQNQLLIDQYQRKVMDIQREQKLFEQEITKLQDFIQGKQKRPLDPTVFASSVFFNALGKKDNINQSPHQYRQNISIKIYNRQLIYNQSKYLPSNRLQLIHKLNSFRSNLNNQTYHLNIHINTKKQISYFLKSIYNLTLNNNNKCSNNNNNNNSNNNIISLIKKCLKTRKLYICLYNLFKYHISYL